LSTCVQQLKLTFLLIVPRLLQQLVHAGANRADELVAVNLRGLSRWKLTKILLTSQTLAGARSIQAGILCKLIN
jgi:hypothetical protein